MFLQVEAHSSLREKSHDSHTNARLAGFTFLAYIATGIASMVLFGQAASGANAAAKLASIAQHATAVRLSAVLTLLTFFEAVVLGVTLFALTHEEDLDLAVLGLCCRVGEGVLGAASAVSTMRLLPVAAASATSGCPGRGGCDRARRLAPEPGGLVHRDQRHLLRRGQHTVLLPVPASPQHPRPARVAGR